MIDCISKTLDPIEDHSPRCQFPYTALPNSVLPNPVLISETLDPLGLKLVVMLYLVKCGIGD